MAESCTRTFAVKDYDLAATLNSGQAFRWCLGPDGWTGVIGSNWVRLLPCPSGVAAQTAAPPSNWDWLTDYLQLDVDLDEILQTFPNDEPLRDAVAACRGLRLLRQDPWECLASFILSSTKQIAQIRQVVAAVCARFGVPVQVPPGAPSAHAFPSAASLVEAGEMQLRACKAGFRAPYLLGAAQRVARGELDLEGLRDLPVADARAELMRLPGVGRKIADCVLLFAYGFPSAFPLDVWVLRALRQLYFPGRRVNVPSLQGFAADHFGPNGGYAQQYLFHYVRVKKPALRLLANPKQVLQP